jgi:hypothetical protein
MEESDVVIGDLVKTVGWRSVADMAYGIVINKLSSELTGTFFEVYVLIDFGQKNEAGRVLHRRAREMENPHDW